MVQVKDILKMEILKNFHIVAGRQGLDREVLVTTILEYEPYIQNYDGFYYGNFVLTSLFFAKDDPDKIAEAFREINQRNVAAVAVKKSIYMELPKEVIEFADEVGLPVFLFDTTYMEQIIVAVNGYVREHDNYDLVEQKIVRFLENWDRVFVAHFAEELYSFPLSRYVVAYIFDEDGTRRIFAAFRQKYSGKKVIETKNDFEIAKFKKGVFIFVSLESESINVKKKLISCLNQIGIDVQKYFCGCSDIQNQKENFDLAMEQSLYASMAAFVEKCYWKEYKEIGIWQIVCPLKKDKAFMQRYHQVIDMLTEYDERYSSELFRTLCAYIDNKGKLSKTASEMYQHVNTIRYRLERIKDMLGIEDVYEYVYPIIKFYHIYGETRN
ncbi:MAG: PucR family transcriptional regulator [Dorea sp.]|nr:PucR family transcriptional regulator [Dorea sp.]